MADKIPAPEVVGAGGCRGVQEGADQVGGGSLGMQGGGWGVPEREAGHMSMMGRVRQEQAVLRQRGVSCPPAPPQQSPPRPEDSGLMCFSQVVEKRPRSPGPKQGPKECGAAVINT